MSGSDDPVARSCGHRGPALSAQLDDATRGSRWWATAQPLPADFATRLNNRGPDDTPDKLLESYQPIKMTQVNGSELRLILTGQCRLPVVFKMGAPYFADKVVDIKEGETYPVEVFGLTKKYTVTWQLGIEAVMAERQRESQSA